MDGPLVYRLNRQVHGRVAKSGRINAEGIVKPPQDEISHSLRSKTLEDDEVDRAEVEVP